MRFWLSLAGIFGALMVVTGLVLAQTGATVNPVVGSVWTYFGPTYGADWGIPAGSQSAWVPNNAALVALTPLTPQVYRAGFNAPGDGGGAIYTHTAAACSLNGGVGDNGSQVKAKDGGCWIADFKDGVRDVRIFGADKTGVADSAAAITAAIASCSHHTVQNGELPTGCKVLLPDDGSNACYRAGSTLDLTDGTTLAGTSMAASCLMATANSNYPLVRRQGTAALANYAASVEEITLKGGGPANTSADCLYFSYAYWGGARNVELHNCYRRVYVANSWQVELKHLRGENPPPLQSAYGLYMDVCSSPGGCNNAVVAEDVKFGRELVNSFRLINFQGSKFSNVESGGTGQNGWYMCDPPLTAFTATTVGAQPAGNQLVFTTASVGARLATNMAYILSSVPGAIDPVKTAAARENAIAAQAPSGANTVLTLTNPTSGVVAAGTVVTFGPPHCEFGHFVNILGDSPAAGYSAIKIWQGTASGMGNMQFSNVWAGATAGQFGNSACAFHVASTTPTTATAFVIKGLLVQDAWCGVGLVNIGASIVDGMVNGYNGADNGEAAVHLENSQNNAILVAGPPLYYHPTPVGYNGYVETSVAGGVSTGNAVYGFGRASCATLVNFSGSPAGITYAAGYPGCSYQIEGLKIMGQVQFQLTGKGTGGGPLTLGPMPWVADGTPAGKGNVSPCFGGNGDGTKLLAGLVSPIFGTVVNTTMSLFMQGPTDAGALTDANLTNSSLLTCSFNYAKP